MQRFPLQTILEVLWADITSYNDGWKSPESAAKDMIPVEVKTIGYVIEDTKQSIKLAMMQAETNGGEVGVTCVIPRSNIKRLKVLKGL